MRSPDAILAAVLRELREHREQFVECQSEGASKDPRRLSSEYLPEFDRMTALIVEVEFLHAQARLQLLRDQQRSQKRKAAPKIKQSRARR